MVINILLIEDNLDHILFTKKILEKAAGEFHLDSASEPKEGLKKIIEQNYDVVLCDYRMPGHTAFDMLKALRQKGKDVPFIVVTASGSEKVAVGLMKEGAYDYIIKDVSYEDTLPVVVRRSLEIFNAKKEKERLEKKIEQAAQEWEATFNSITDLVSIHDKDSRILRVNKAFKDMFMMSDEEIVNKKCHEILHGTADIPWPNCPHNNVLETKRPQQIEFFEPRFKSYLEVSVSPIFDEKGEIMATVHITKDITKRKKAEQKLADAYQELKDTQEQLIQSSKMAAMGQLAAGISHELNQPLTGIKGFAQAVHMDMEEDNPLKEDINKIIEQADRMDRIIKNIRLFARKSEFEMQEIDINQPIESAVMLMNEQLKVHNILLKKQLDENLPKIEGDLNQFQQVFLNLITNARDAIDSLKRPDGGELTIKTCLNEDKKNIEIYFQDTGCGIPSEHLENIFNPFFTTKSPDGGIGLGLSIAYRIIENHKGRIEVRSKVGEGTTFKIIIPVNPVKT